MLLIVFNPFPWATHRPLKGFSIGLRAVTKTNTTIIESGVRKASLRNDTLEYRDFVLVWGPLDYFEGNLSKGQRIPLYYTRDQLEGGK